MLILKIYCVMGIGAIIDLLIYTHDHDEMEEVTVPAVLVAFFLNPMYWYIIIKHMITGDDE
jgi:hypothetical protein